jgi:hypothetical protein
MPRRMADPGFRAEQWRRRYDDHIAPINRLVDSMREAGPGHMPYVAPMYGGVHARLISILRDPGPKTLAETGSGFLCMENDDATAEAICRYFADADIDAREIVPWNAYPWYINRNPSAAELRAGIEPLFNLIQLLTDLRVIMLHGGAAKSAWSQFTRAHSRVMASRPITVIATYHTSRQAFWHRDSAVREARREHLRRAFAQAARCLKD